VLGVPGDRGRSPAKPAGVVALSDRAPPRRERGYRREGVGRLPRELVGRVRRPMVANGFQAAQAWAPATVVAAASAARVRPGANPVGPIEKRQLPLPDPKFAATRRCVSPLIGPATIP